MLTNCSIKFFEKKILWGEETELRRKRIHPLQNKSINRNIQQLEDFWTGDNQNFNTDADLYSPERLQSKLGL